jgi:RNA polymerase sigma factor (sigma-70 family)
MAFDEKDFTTFVNDRKGLLRNLIRRAARLTDWDVEDVFQDLSIRLFEKAGSIPLSKLRLQLAGFTRNCVYEFLRRQALPSLTDEISEHLPSEQSPLDQALIRDREQNRVRAAIAMLPRDLREIYVLKFAEGFSYDRIAKRFKISKSTAYERVRRARAELHAALDFGFVEGRVVGPNTEPIHSALACIRGGSFSPFPDHAYGRIRRLSICLPAPGPICPLSAQGRS